MEIGLKAHRPISPLPMRIPLRLTVNRVQFWDWAIVPLAAVLTVLVQRTSYVPTTTWIPPMVTAAGLALALIRLRYGLAFFLAAILLYDEFSKYGLSLTAPELISIFTAEVSGLSLSLLWTSALACILVAGILLQPNLQKALRVNQSLRLLSLLAFGAAVIGLPNLLQNSRSYISDFGFIINLFVGFGAAAILLKNRKDFLKVLAVFLAISLTQYLLTVHETLFISRSYNFLFQYKAGSGAYLSILVATLGFLLLAGQVQKRKMLYWSIGLGILSVFALYSIVTASRGRFAIAFIALLATAVSPRRLPYLVVSILFLPVAFLAVDSIAPHVTRIAVWKLTTFDPRNPDSGSASVRYVELLNIASMHLHKLYSLPFGTGMGGYFTDEYFPHTTRLYGMSAYPDEWIAAGIYYKPHGTPLYLLLKAGLFGTLALYTIVIRISRSALRVRPSPFKDPLFSSWIVALAVCSPLLFLVNFTSKLQIFSGFMLGALHVYASTHTAPRRLRKIAGHEAKPGAARPPAPGPVQESVRVETENGPVEEMDAVEETDSVGTRN